MRLTLACLLAGLAALAQGTAAGRDWPRIRPATGVRTYVDPGAAGADTPFLLSIASVRGAPVYRLECHNGNYEAASPIDFSGDFHCALFAIEQGRRTSGNLLATEAPAQRGSDWLNRGRMTANQLYGACAAVADHGATRRFRLRGMLVTLQFTDLRWKTDTLPGEPRLDRFTFRARAVPDPEARTARSAPAPVSARDAMSACDLPPGG